MLYAKLQDAEARSGGRLLLRLSPLANDLPVTIQKFDDPFLPWTRAVVDATRAHVCGYLFDMAAYLALGAAGAVALERGVALVVADPPRAAILDGRFASPAYSAICHPTAFAPDAATVLDAATAEAFQQAGVPALVVGQGAGDGLDLVAGQARIAGKTFTVLDAMAPAVSRSWDFSERLEAYVVKAKAASS